jgi:hypothetical protein
MELIYDSLLIPDFYNSSNQTSKTNTYELIKQLNWELQTSFSGLWSGYIYEIVVTEIFDMSWIFEARSSYNLPIKDHLSWKPNID